MEENKNLKFNLKIVISIVILLIIIATILIVFIITRKNTGTVISPNFTIKNYNNNDYYIINGDYSGEYDLQYVGFAEFHKKNVKDFEKKEVMDYNSYIDYCKKWNITSKYSDNSLNYIVFSYLAYGAVNIDARLAEVEYNSGNVNLYVWDNSFGVTADASGYVIIVPTKNIINTINIVPLYMQSEFNNLKKYNTLYDSYDLTLDKPIIYLYPESDTNVSVSLGYSNKLTCSYPKYTNNGWKVLATPNGDLIDLSNNRSLYSLYYESQSVSNFSVTNEGFIVKGAETSKFLEEKLAILGLTEHEAEEFIIYWLPKLEANTYNYIRFATMEEINKNMPLNINPTPDSIIRVLMTYKGLDKPINIKEQVLESPSRNGFVAVEWGGTEIKR